MKNSTAMLQALFTIYLAILVREFLGLDLDPPPQGDFWSYYASSNRLLSGLPPYQPFELGEAQSMGGLNPTLGSEGVVGVRVANPPSMLLLYYPIALVSYTTSWWLLFGFSLCAIGGTSFLVAQTLRRPFAECALWTTISLCALPTFVFLMLNRVESIPFLLGVLGWIALRKEKSALTGILWGTSAALKLFPAFWIVLLWASGQKRAALIGVATATAWLLASAMAFGLVTISDFIQYVIPQSQTFMARPGNHSLISLGWSIGAPGVGWTLAILVALWAIWAAYRRKSADETWILGVAASLLCSPLSWSYYYVLAYSAVIIRATSLNTTRQVGRAYLVALVSLVMFWPGLLGGGLNLNRAPEALFLLGTCGPMVGLLALMALPPIKTQKGPQTSV